jgi:penicillin-binding protein 1A
MKRVASLRSHRFWSVCGGLLVCVTILLVGTFVFAAARAPSVRDLAARVANFDRSHSAVAVPLSAVAPSAREAIVATEDERFYQNGGVDLIALVRAIPFDLSHFSLAQGASTIPEQLAKIIYLSGNDHSPSRKSEDIVLGYRLGHGYSHERLLAAYLNTVYLGDGQYGIENASRHYFGRSARDLSVDQASLLMGLAQAPSLYDPRTDPSAARARQVQVLQSMVRNGYITESEASATIARPLRLANGGIVTPLRLSPETFAVPAPFDVVELVAAIVMFALALLVFALGRLFPRPLLRQRAARVAWSLLLLISALTAAHSVQVL